MYGYHPVPKSPHCDGQFIAMKAHKRLWIQDVDTGALLYTPPDFIHLTDRTPLQDLARTASRKGALEISDIIAFEADQRKPRIPPCWTRS